ncbi:hypothetical protein BP6252_12853 [Coleophoma cylindrospora]|uniref:Uncharacterized protein n=1 Tax=Coleophoma cylindrospora TaxID=1849047 RepID=A0A3D8QD30_9HELO|nr:hypothetical protein BP6252_12853 [Coleophoma cylindrospora]
MCNYKSTYHPFCGHSTKPILYETCEVEVKAKEKGKAKGKAKAKAICSFEDAKYHFRVTSAQGACSACEVEWQAQGFVSAESDPEAVERRRRAELKQPSERELTSLEKIMKMHQDNYASWTAVSFEDWMRGNRTAPN